MRVVAYGFLWRLALGTIAPRPGPRPNVTVSRSATAAGRDGARPALLHRPATAVSFRSSRPQWDEPGRPRSRDTGPNVEATGVSPGAPDNRETQYGRPGDSPAPVGRQKSDRGKIAKRLASPPRWFPRRHPGERSADCCINNK